MRQRAPLLAGLSASILLIVAAVASVAQSSDAQSPVAQSEVTTYTPTRIRWRELHYTASKFGIKAESETTMRLIPAAEAADRLLAVEGGQAVMPSGDQVAEIVIRTRVGGSRGVSTMLLDPSSAAAYQRSQESTPKKEKKAFFRTYRYLTDGVFIERRMPEGDATGLPSDWPVRNTRTIPFAPGICGRPVTEAMALFYILSAADLEAVGDELRFLNFSREGMSEVVMTVGERVPWDVDYIEVSPAGERRVKERHEVARLTISGTSVGKSDEDFEFLGLRGTLEVFADPDLRIPVAVRGKAPYVGKMTVEVDKIVVD